MPGADRRSLQAVLSGIAITAAIGAAAWGVAAMVTLWSGRASLDAVVLAILGGIIVRSLWAPGPRTAPGIDVAARQLLELAIVLLGLSTDMRWLVRAGAPLAGAIVAVTLVALGAGILWGRVFGLAPSHALLVASGNAICGNSAIAAVATVTGARREETASAVAYTAVLSLALVLALPFIGELASLGDVRYGVAAGLTVYAVPQVLAAAYPVSVRAGQIGTMVKLVRVLMLVPIVVVLSWRSRAVRQAQQQGGSEANVGHVAAGRLLPWYVLAFVIAAVIGSVGAIPPEVARGGQHLSHALTVMAMAALGLGVDTRLLRRVGWRAAATATVSLLTLCLLATIVVVVMPEGAR